MDLIINILMFPVRLVWNVIVTAGIVAFGAVFYGAVFGSVVIAIVIVLFAPSLLLLPVMPASLYVKMWD